MEACIINTFVFMYVHLLWIFKRFGFEITPLDWNYVGTIRRTHIATVRPSACPQTSPSNVDILQFLSYLNQTNRTTIAYIPRIFQI